jgi:ABC-type nitrate/sulfonate/bicarbonate transport system substrate-binding protein
MYSRRVILGSLAASALATQIRPARAASPLTIRAGWVVAPADLFPIMTAMPHVAKHMGTSYKLELQHFAGTTAMITALASGAIDTATLAFSSLPFAIENAHIDDLRVIADSFQDGVEGYYTNPFLVLKNGPIHKIEDLKGKVLATNTQGSAVDIAMRVMLRKHGIDDRTDVNIIEAPFPTMKALLEEQKAALIPGVLPFTGDPSLMDISRALFTQKDAVGQTQMIIHVARQSYYDKHRAAMIDMLEDSLRVQRYLETPANHNDAVSIVSQVTKAPAARFQSWLFKKDGQKGDYYRNPKGVPNLKALQTNIDTQKKLGFLDKAIDVKKYTDLSLVDEAAKRLTSA